MKFQAIYQDDYNAQMGGVDYDLQLIEEQVKKYYEYLNKGYNNPAYQMAKKQLDDITKELKSNTNVASLIRELTEIFNMLSEHGFPMGRAKYPGPGDEWKKLVNQYIF